jgi:hypothetical protein
MKRKEERNTRASLLFTPPFSREFNINSPIYRRTDGMLSLWSWDIGSDCEAGNPIREDGESPALMRGELSMIHSL